QRKQRRRDSPQDRAARTGRAQLVHGRERPFEGPQRYPTASSVSGARFLNAPPAMWGVFLLGKIAAIPNWEQTGNGRNAFQLRPDLRGEHHPGTLLISLPGIPDLGKRN